MITAAFLCISMRISKLSLFILYKDLTRKNIYWGGSWFKFNDLELVLGTSLKFHRSLAKRLKKVRKLLGLISAIGDVTGEKLVGAKTRVKKIN